MFTSLLQEFTGPILWNKNCFKYKISNGFLANIKGTDNSNYISNSIAYNNKKHLQKFLHKASLILHRVYTPKHSNIHCIMSNRANILIHKYVHKYSKQH